MRTISGTEVEKRLHCSWGTVRDLVKEGVLVDLAPQHPGKKKHYAKYDAGMANKVAKVYRPKVRLVNQLTTLMEALTAPPVNGNGAGHGVAKVTKAPKVRVPKVKAEVVQPEVVEPVVVAPVVTAPVVPVVPVVRPSRGIIQRLERLEQLLGID